MAEVILYKQDGSEAGKVKLPDEIFAVAPKPALIHEVIVAQEANGRTRYAQVKDRSEVRGGGRKPWRQKGTGRARHGSRRSPIWTGGGVTFGPNADKNYTKKVNKKVKRQALAMVLSDKVTEKWLIAVEDFKLDEPKTKLIAAMREKLPGAGQPALLVTTAEDQNLIQAAKNLPKTETINAGSLNVRDLVKYQHVIASQAALDKIKEIYA